MGMVGSKYWGGNPSPYAALKWQPIAMRDAHLALLKVVRDMSLVWTRTQTQDKNAAWRLLGDVTLQGMAWGIVGDGTGHTCPHGKGWTQNLCTWHCGSIAPLHITS